MDLRRRAVCTGQDRLHPVLIDLDEAPQGPVECLLYIVRKQTGWKLFHLPMIVQALTAYAFARTGIIGAVAFLQVFFFLACVHRHFLSVLIRFFDTAFSKEISFGGDNQPAQTAGLQKPAARSVGCIQEARPTV